MSKFKKFSFLLFLIFFTITIAIYFSMQDKAQSVVRIPLKSQIKVPDPQHMHSAVDAFIVNQIHKSLFQNDSSLKVHEDLVESYEVFDSSKTYRFFLKDLNFSSGQKLEAKHVENTFKRIFIKNGEMALDLNYIAGADEMRKGIAEKFGVRAINKNIVEFRLDHANPLFLTHLAAVDCAILPISFNSEEITDFSNGLGDYYLFDIVNLPEKLVLKSKYYSSTNNYPKTVVFEHVDKDSAIDNALNGYYDTLDGFSLNDSEKNKLLSAGFIPTVSANTNFTFLYINERKVSNEVRENISAALLQNFPMPEEPFVRAFGIIPNILGGSLQVEDLDFLRNFSTNKKIPIELKIGIIKSEPTVAKYFEDIKSILLKIGIKLKAVDLTMPEMIEEIKNRKLELLLQGKFLDYPDGMALLSYFRSDGVNKNSYGINDKRINFLISKAELELDVKKREALYREIQVLVLKKHTVFPISFGSLNMGFWKKKFIVPPHPLGLHSLRLSDLRVKN